MLFSESIVQELIPILTLATLGYRDNKVRALLLKNNELEEELKQEKANVLRLARTNDALEKQLVLLNSQVKSTQERVFPRKLLTPFILHLFIR